MRKSTELETLWAEYKRTDSVELRNQCTELYLPLARNFANNFVRHLPSSIDVDTVFSACVVGLIDAVEGFDPTRGIKFSTYCLVRMRGSVLDELRSLDWVPRRVRDRANKFGRAVQDLSHRLGRKPAHLEIMADLQLTPEVYDDILLDISHLHVYSLEIEGFPREDEDGGSKSSHSDDKPWQSSLACRLAGPGESAELAEKKEAVRKGLDALDRRHKTLLFLYYFDFRTLREIGRTLHLSEARVCQEHGEALKLLSEAMSPAATH